MSNPPLLAFIGGGNMARALIGGLIENGHAADAILVSEPDAGTAARLQRDFGVRLATDNKEAATAADVVVLAVKPQQLARVCATIAPAVQRGRPLLISIAAGIRERSIEEWLGGDVMLVRCMPNTPALVGAGMTGLHAGPGVDAVGRALAERILGAVGEVLWVEEESLLDAVTAVSGSGPAYYFLFMEAMIDAGERLGLSREAATRLTLQTALGAARMARAGDEPPGVLRQRVTSPGGTTEQALRHFEQGGLRELVVEALRKARDRSIELSDQLAGSA